MMPQESAASPSESHKPHPPTHPDSPSPAEGSETDLKETTLTDTDTIRRATDHEIAIARAWVEHTYADAGHSPELEAERQSEYEHALEVLVFANGGRHTEPAPEVLTKLATVVLDDRRDELDDLMVAVLQQAAEAPPSPLRDAVIAMAEQAWADEYAETEEAATDESMEN